MKRKVRQAPRHSRSAEAVRDVGGEIREFYPIGTGGKAPIRLFPADPPRDLCGTVHYRSKPEELPFETGVSTLH
jgi:hypothetical protein